MKAALSITLYTLERIRTMLLGLSLIVLVKLIPIATAAGIAAL